MNDNEVLEGLEFQTLGSYEEELEKLDRANDTAHTGELVRVRRIKPKEEGKQ